MNMKIASCAAVCMLAMWVTAGDYSMKDLTLSHPDGFYKSGEEVAVTGQLFKAGSPVTDGSLRVVTKWEARTVSTKDYPCDGKPFRITYKNDKPGWVYFGFMVVGKDGKVIENPGTKAPQGKKKQLCEIGAIYDSDKIRSKVEMPADFREYWKKVRADLDRVPFNAQLKKLDSKDPKIELYALTVDAGGDRPVTGYLAYPAGAKPKSLAAYVNFLSWTRTDCSRYFAVSGAKKGLLALSTSWHGFPVNQPKSFYEKEIGEKFDARRNIDNRDKWEFRNVYLRVLRALDYIKSRPEWDGKTLVVQGGSLAGAQSAVAAALDPQVTTAIISVPCFCEFNADLDGRRRSIPVSGFTPLKPEIRKALGYFDVVNMAALIRCEVFFATGFADEGCPPSNVLAAYNNLPASTPKALTTHPATGHYGTTVNVKANERLKKFFQNVKVGAYTEKY